MIDKSYRDLKRHAMLGIALARAASSLAMLKHSAIALLRQHLLISSNADSMPRALMGQWLG
ncbi:MAG: hypothetical protein U1F68_20900 [Gammaproteobacteria bacterium]